MTDLMLLERLTEIEGYQTPDDLMEASLFDSVCPSICTNVGCEYTADLEPDQDRGWCEACETNSMKSAQVLWLETGAMI